MMKDTPVIYCCDEEDEKIALEMLNSVAQLFESIIECYYINIKCIDNYISTILNKSKLSTIENLDIINSMDSYIKSAMKYDENISYFFTLYGYSPSGKLEVTNCSSMRV